MTQPQSDQIGFRRTLALVALMGAISSPGCGSVDDTATNDGGASGDAGTTDDGGETIDGGVTMTSLDAAVVSDLDATVSSTDAKGSTPTGHPAQYVSLGTAGSFVVLAGETITNTGFTVINGNVGISPGTAITGFPPGVVNGIVHSADAVAAKAKQDLNDAYNDAASRSGAPVTIAGDLGGLTLPPGLYVSATSLGLDSGDLTLDAAGDEDAIWVFQITTTFVAKVNHGVFLARNARADNVFWNVGSSATIGVGVHMVGNFLTETSITVQTGASMEGRFLTQVGAVTFDSNQVNRPHPVH